MNVVTEKRWWLWTSSYKEMMALNTKLRWDGGSERPNWEEMVALNAKLRRDGGSKRQTKKGWWLWTPKLRRDGGFERPNWEGIVTLNAKLRRNSDSERQTMNIKRKVIINSSQTWSEITSIMNVMMERAMTQSPYEKVTHLTLKEIWQSEYKEKRISESSHTNSQ